MQAANYLDIKNMLDLTCQSVANIMRGMTPDEIRKTFNIKNDFSPKEEEEIRRKIIGHSNDRDIESGGGKKTYIFLCFYAIVYWFVVIENLF